jgi:hypothetical protein
MPTNGLRTMCRAEMVRVAVMLGARVDGMMPPWTIHQKYLLTYNFISDKNYK